MTEKPGSRGVSTTSVDWRIRAAVFVRMEPDFLASGGEVVANFSGKWSHVFRGESTSIAVSGAYGTGTTSRFIAFQRSPRKTDTATARISNRAADAIVIEVIPDELCNAAKDDGVSWSGAGQRD